MKTDKRKKIFIIILIAVFSVILFCLFFFRVDKYLKVIFLDVGQGDSILIRTPEGRNILVDGGPDRTVTARLSSYLPWWDRSIDLMILTHSHDDHVNGLNFVLDKYRVGRVMYTGISHDSPGYLAWLRRIRENKIPVSIVLKPERIILGRDLFLEILYPMGSLLNQEASNLNNSSVVSRLVYEKNRFLFTGDAEKQVEEELLGKNKDISADILKVAHHGSDTGTGDVFLERVNPKIAVISVGDNNFGHPSRLLLYHLEKRGIRVLITKQNGSIGFRSNGLEISPLRNLE